MKIISPSTQIITPFGQLTPEVGVKMLRHIESMARISHRSEDGQTDETWQVFLHNVLVKRGDWSVAEHASATTIIRTDRGITHEIVRHRHFSFTMESTRFVRYGAKRDLEFIMPTEFAGERSREWFWRQSMEEAELAYQDLLDAHARPQEARSVLPNSLAATIAVTGNLRSWRQFLLARTTIESHPDMRQVTLPLLAEFKRLIPIIFDDIEPLARQIANFQKAS